MSNNRQETLQVLEELAVSVGLTFHCWENSYGYERSFKAEKLSTRRNGSTDIHVWKPDNSLIYRIHPQPNSDLSVLTLNSCGDRTVLFVGQDQQPKYDVTIMTSRSTGGCSPTSISHKDYDLMLARLEGAGKYHPPQGDLADIRR